MPFNSFENAELTLSVWRLIVIAILVLLLRRLPVMLALYRWIPDVKTFREAVLLDILALSVLGRSLSLRSLRKPSPNRKIRKRIKSRCWQRPFSPSFRSWCLHRSRSTVSRFRSSRSVEGSIPCLEHGQGTSRWIHRQDPNGRHIRAVSHVQKILSSIAIVDIPTAKAH